MQILDKYWANIRQILGTFWANIGQILQNIILGKIVSEMIKLEIIELRRIVWEILGLEKWTWKGLECIGLD